MMYCSALKFNSFDYLINVLQIYEKHTDVNNYFLIVLKTCSYSFKQKKNHDINFSVKDFYIHVEDVCVSA